MTHPTRIGPDPAPPLEAFNQRASRALREQLPPAAVREVVAEGQQLLESERAEEGRLRTESASRRIRLASDAVQERHAASRREAERRVLRLEGLLAELEAEVPKREAKVKALAAKFATCNADTAKVASWWLQEYLDGAMQVMRSLREAKEQQDRIGALRREGAGLESELPPLCSLTGPIAEGTEPLRAIWGADQVSVRLPLPWSEHRTIWPVTPGFTASDLMMPPPVRKPFRPSPAAVAAQAEGEAHLDLTEPFVHRGTLEDDNKARERLAEAARLREQHRRTGVLHPGVRPEDLK